MTGDTYHSGEATAHRQTYRVSERERQRRAKTDLYYLSICTVYLSRSLLLYLSMTCLSASVSCLVISFMLSEVFEQLVLGAVGKRADTATMFSTTRTLHPRFLSSICRQIFGIGKMPMQCRILEQCDMFQV